MPTASDGFGLRCCTKQSSYEAELVFLFSGATLRGTEVLGLRRAGREKCFKQEKCSDPFGWVEEAPQILLAPALVCPPLAPVSLSHPPCPRSLNTGAENALMDFSQSLKIFFFLRLLETAATRQ